MDKNKYKQEIKNIGNEIINDLEPIVKKNVNKFFDIFKELADDGLSFIFKKNKTKNKEKKN